MELLIICQYKMPKMICTVLVIFAPISHKICENPSSHQLAFRQDTHRLPMKKLHPYRHSLDTA